MTVTKIELDDIEIITVSSITENSRGFVLTLNMTDSLGGCTELILNSVDKRELKKLRGWSICRVPEPLGN